MYLRQVDVKNVRRIKSLKVDFTEDDGEPRMWTAIVGDAGACKTTLLQCIAMTAYGDDPMFLNVGSSNRTFPRRSGGVQAKAVSVEASYDVHLSRGLAKLQSKVALSAKKGLWKPTSKLVFRPGVGEVVESARHLQQVRQNRIYEPEFFVAAYGTARSALPNRNHGKNASIRTRVKHLFTNDPDLLNMSLNDDLCSSAWSRDTVIPGYAEALREVVGVGDDALIPGVDQFEVSTVVLDGDRKDVLNYTFMYHGERIPLVDLPQSYQSLLTWVFDLVGSILQNQKAPQSLAELRGLVLVDGLDLAIHPKLQPLLIPRLRRLFPKLQFVVTVTAPFTLSSLNADEIVQLTIDEHGDVVQAPQGPPPALMTATSLLESYFGACEMYPNELGEVMSRYGYLIGDPGRSPKEDAELGKLQSILAERGVDPGWEPVPIDPELQRADPSPACRRANIL